MTNNTSQSLQNLIHGKISKTEGSQNSTNEEFVCRKVGNASDKVGDSEKSIKKNDEKVLSIFLFDGTIFVPYHKHLS
jgi:hypothetical protein